MPHCWSPRPEHADGRVGPSHHDRDAHRQAEPVAAAGRKDPATVDASSSEPVRVDADGCDDLRCPASSRRVEESGPDPSFGSVATSPAFATSGRPWAT
jgi:hypothetical protein